MEELRPNEQRAKNAITLIWVVLAVEILSFISGYFQYNLLETIASGGEISLETADSNDIREQIIAILNVSVRIISAITFIQWFRRAYYNLHLKVDNLSHSEGWAAGSWFVPIFYLYKPYQIMKELYRETNNLLTKSDLDDSPTLNTSFLGIWWTIWILSNIIGQFIFRYSLNAETIDTLSFVTTASMVNNVIEIPLAFITIKIINDYSKVETLLNEISVEAQTDSNENESI